MFDSPMRAAHSVPLAIGHHSNCLVTFSITPHMAFKHLLGHTVKIVIRARLAGPGKSAWLYLRFKISDFRFQISDFTFQHAYTLVNL